MIPPPLINWPWIECPPLVNGPKYAFKEFQEVLKRAMEKINDIWEKLKEFCPKLNNLATLSWCWLLKMRMPQIWLVLAKCTRFCTFELYLGSTDENLLLWRRDQFLHFQILSQHNSWGMDLFKVGELTHSRPLTAIVYSIFQVSLSLGRSFKSSTYISIMILVITHWIL